MIRPTEWGTYELHLVSTLEILLSGIYKAAFKCFFKKFIFRIDAGEAMTAENMLDIKLNFISTQNLQAIIFISINQ